MEGREEKFSLGQDELAARQEALSRRDDDRAALER